MNLLSLIKYTDSQGHEEKFYLISEVQNDCHNLGIQLDVSPATLNGLRSTYGNPPDFCREILRIWINQGEGVSWGRLLQALDDIKLGGIANRLSKALSGLFQ